MKSLYVLILSLVLINIPISLSAQYDNLVKHWTFESKDATHQAILTNNQANYVSGVKGQGVLMNRENGYIDMTESEDLLNEFTFSFWFKPNNINDKQTLFYHFRQVRGDFFIRSFLRLEIENGRFKFKNEDKDFSISSVALEKDKWYYLNYTFDGTSTKLYLQGKEIYATSDKISVYQKVSYKMENRMFIGCSHIASTQFEGVVDEVMIFNKAIDTRLATQIFEDNSTNQIAKVQVKAPVKPTTSPPIREAELPLENEVEPIADIDDTPKTITPVAPQLVVVENYSVLDPLVVRTTGVVLELIAKDAYDDDAKIMVALNDAFLDVPFNISKDKKTIKIPLNLGKENSFTFEAFQINEAQDCQVQAKIVSNGKVVGTYDMDLKKNNVVLPIAYLRAKDKKPRNYKSITVNDVFVTIQVKDNSKVDGDVITIKQDGTTILENYTLTAELKNIEVELKENRANEFIFVPVAMGSSSGENTALVIISINGQIIHDFSLRSIDQNRPAKLTINHESF